MENIWLKVLAIIVFSGIWAFFVFNEKIKVDKTATRIIATIVYVGALYQMLSNW